MEALLAAEGHILQGVGQELRTDERGPVAGVDAFSGTVALLGCPDVEQPGLHRLLAFSLLTLEPHGALDAQPTEDDEHQYTKAQDDILIFQELSSA